MKRIAVLGATGSIGTQTLDVVRQHRDKLQVVSLVAAKSGDRLIELAQEHGVRRIGLYDEVEARRLGVPGGMQAIVGLSSADDVDLVVVCVAGVIGLLPTIEAIKNGKQIALASKEVLVAGGEIVMPLLDRYGTTMTPIDSEHSAIFQCIQGAPEGSVDELILTASGGPFRGWTSEQLKSVTVEQTLNHPTWRMGGKITVDSATLMNKGLETIEAKWLFGVPVEKVQVVVHPQSIIHSLVKFKDGSALGQLGWPDMRLPIQYALLYPERVPNDLRPWNPVETPALSFEEVDHATFPCLNLAKESARIGGTMPCAMNAANEEAANAFLAGKLAFDRIPIIVEQVMSKQVRSDASLDNVLKGDAEARRVARELMQ